MCDCISEMWLNRISNMAQRSQKLLSFASASVISCSQTSFPLSIHFSPAPFYLTRGRLCSNEYVHNKIEFSCQVFFVIVAMDFSSGQKKRQKLMTLIMPTDNLLGGLKIPLNTYLTHLKQNVACSVQRNKLISVMIRKSENCAQSCGTHL